MILKVCGITDPKNMQSIAGLGIQMIGLNFYPKSPRYVQAPFEWGNLKELNNSIQLVGVFVNASTATIQKKIHEFQLDYIQLHGDESPQYCKEIQQYAKIIKVFRMDDGFCIEQTGAFNFSDYFLFDTKVSEYGGSGKKFNWGQLAEYSGPVEFILSGGISPEDAQDIHHFKHSFFAGVDINSQFEIKPGVKNIQQVKDFNNELKILN